MASTKDYLTYVLDLLSKIDNISCKRMMGEYLLYADGVLFGGIYDDRFLMKKTTSLSDYGFNEEIPYDGAKPMYLIDVENKDEIKMIVEKAVNDLSNKN